MVVVVLSGGGGGIDGGEGRLVVAVMVERCGGKPCDVGGWWLG